jgi:hypothetical protein
MPSISGYNKIRLKTHEEGPFIEGPLAAAALPGMNVVMTAAVDTQQRQTYTPGATAAGGTAAGAAAGPVKILCEDSLQGKTVFDTYAAGDNGFIYACQPGDIVQVLALTGQTIAKGAALSADATGRWILATINARVETLEGSGGVALTADTLIRVRVF